MVPSPPAEFDCPLCGTGLRVKPDTYFTSCPACKTVAPDGTLYAGFEFVPRKLSATGLAWAFHPRSFHGPDYPSDLFLAHYDPHPVIVER